MLCWVCWLDGVKWAVLSDAMCDEHEAEYQAWEDSNAANVG